MLSFTASAASFVAQPRKLCYLVYNFRSFLWGCGTHESPLQEVPLTHHLPPARQLNKTLVSQFAVKGLLHHCLRGEKVNCPPKNWGWRSTQLWTKAEQRVLERRKQPGVAHKHQGPCMGHSGSWQSPPGAEIIFPFQCCLWNTRNVSRIFSTRVTSYTFTDFFRLKKISVINEWMKFK